MEGRGEGGEGGLGGWGAVGRHVESVTRYAFRKVCVCGRVWMLVL